MALSARLLCRVTVCRGCCCGTDRKHPGVDHDAQLDTLRDLLTGTARVRAVDCLGPCERSNVVVVQPSPSGRAGGGRPVWLGRVLDEGQLRLIAEWVADGGPGVGALPAALRAHRFAAPPTADRA
jgi:hypothetical protein